MPSRCPALRLFGHDLAHVVLGEAADDVTRFALFDAQENLCDEVSVIGDGTTEDCRCEANAFWVLRLAALFGEIVHVRNGTGGGGDAFSHMEVVGDGELRD